MVSPKGEGKKVVVLECSSYHWQKLKSLLGRLLKQMTENKRVSNINPFVFLLF